MDEPDFLVKEATLNAFCFVTSSVIQCKWTSSNEARPLLEYPLQGKTPLRSGKQSFFTCLYIQYQEKIQILEEGDYP